MFRAVPGLILVGFIWLEDPTMGYDIGVGRPAQTSVLFSTRASSTEESMKMPTTCLVPPPTPPAALYQQREGATQ